MSQTPDSPEPLRSAPAPLRSSGAPERSDPTPELLRSAPEHINIVAPTLQTPLIHVVFPSSCVSHTSGALQPHAGALRSAPERSDPTPERSGGVGNTGCWKNHMYQWGLERRSDNIDVLRSALERSGVVPEWRRSAPEWRRSAPE